MQKDYFEASFEGFGYREMDLAAQLLKEYSDCAPDFMENWDFVKVGFNANSGMVFLTDDDGHVAVLENDELKEFTSCDECNAEGTVESIEHAASCKMPKV